MSSLPGVRALVRQGPGEGEQHLALMHWVLSSRNFAVKTLQKEEVGARSYQIVGPVLAVVFNPLKNTFFLIFFLMIFFHVS